MIRSTSKSTYRKKPHDKPILLQNRYRSKLEERIGDHLEEHKVPFTYEKTKLKCIIPARESKYTPDFHLNGKILIEGKGWPFGPSDRQKLILIKEQNPEIDLRIVFYDAHKPIYKGSKTTMAAWAESHGFPWAHKLPPKQWIDEALHG